MVLNAAPWPPAGRCAKPPADPLAALAPCKLQAPNLRVSCHWNVLPSATRHSARIDATLHRACNGPLRESTRHDCQTTRRLRSSIPATKPARSAQPDAAILHFGRSIAQVAANGIPKVAPSGACTTVSRGDRVPCLLRELLDSLRRRRRDSRRRRPLGIRRSAGRAVESRCAAAGDSGVARRPASRASAARDHAGTGMADAREHARAAPRRIRPDRNANRG